MNNITYFVAPKGEGKTKWLRERVIEETEKGNTVHFYTQFYNLYLRFAESFFNDTGKLCEVRWADKSSDIRKGDIVIIDNLTISVDTHVTVLQAICEKAGHVYITLEGNLGNEHICKCGGKCHNEN